MVVASALLSVDFVSITMSSHTKDFTSGIYCFLLGPLNGRNSVNKSLRIRLIDVTLGKALKRILSPACGR